MSTVSEVGPGVLVVRFEGWVVLGQDEPTPRKCCAVRISQMMHVLGDAPLAGNGCGNKRMLIDAADDRVYLCREHGELVNGGVMILHVCRNLSLHYGELY